MLLKKLLIVFVLALLTACSSTGDNAAGNAVVEDRSGDNSEVDGDAYEGQTGAYNDSGMAQGSSVGRGASTDDALSDPNNPLSVRTIYFEYDSISINAQGQSALNAHAEYLSLNPEKILIVEGHTDERGTRDYNLALGERRSIAIVEFLGASGVPVEQLEVRSYGEESPAALEHDESAWRLNRRVELLY